MPRDERAPDPLGRAGVGNGAFALPGARARWHLRRPLLRARDDLVAVPGRGNHPLGLGRRQLRPRGPGGRGRADRLRLHRRPVLGRDGAGRRDGRPHRPGLEERPAAARLASPRRPALRRDERRRAVARRAHRPRRAGGPRGAGRRPAHREGVREPRRADAPGADRELARRAGRGRAAAVLDPRERDRERQGRAARGLGRRRRPARAGVLRGQAARALRARGGAHGDHPAGSGRGAGRDDAGGAGAGLARDPAPRGGRPRPRGRLQPQGARRPSPAGSASAWRRRASRSWTTARSPTAAAA